MNAVRSGDPQRVQAAAVMSSPMVAKAIPSLSVVRSSGSPTVRSTASSGGGAMTTTLNKLRSFGYQLGLSPKQVDILIKHFQTTGEMPNYGNYKSILKKAQGGGLFGMFGIPTAAPTKPVITTIPEVDADITAVTGDPTVTNATGFERVEPFKEQNFFDKNKTWLIPVGAVALIGGIYLLTKKKK